MTPPKTFLRSILSPCPRPGGNLLLALGWHQPPSPPGLGGAMRPRSNLNTASADPLHALMRRWSRGLVEDHRLSSPPHLCGGEHSRAKSQQATSCHPLRGWGATGHLLHRLILGDGHFMAHKANAFSFSDAQEEVRPVIETSPPLERINPPYLLTLHTTTRP